MTTPQPRGNRGLQRDALPARALAHLAGNGPTEREELERALAGASEHTLAVALCRLRDLGFVKTKVWLTPEGLAELRRIGIAPTFAGTAAAPSCGCEAQPCGCPL